VCVCVCVCVFVCVWVLLHSYDRRYDTYEMCAAIWSEWKFVVELKAIVISS